MNLKYIFAIVTFFTLMIMEEHPMPKVTEAVRPRAASILEYYICCQYIIRPSVPHLRYLAVAFNYT